MDLKIFTSSIAQLAEEKGIAPEKIMEIIEMAIAAAYKKEYGKKGQNIKAELNPKTGDLKFKQIKLVVDDSMIYSEEELDELKEGKGSDEISSGESAEEEKKLRFNAEKHIMVEDAKKINPKIKTQEELEIPLDTKIDYGRIAAQTAKQVIMQRIREAEKESVSSEYKTKEGEIISGIVQRVEGRNVYLDIGKTLGVLPREEQVPGEFYRPGQRLKVYLLKVEEGTKGAMVFLSRAYPKIISKLFELEVPEIASGQVEIKSIAREPGSRSKVAVAANQEDLDPIGAMVGQKGTRVTAVINELGGEKIDIIEYSDDTEKYISNALSPAKVTEVHVFPRNKAEVSVPEDQLSLAIGKEGQNVRLAAKLTGWKIDVNSSGEVVPDQEASSSTSPDNEVVDSKDIATDKKSSKKTSEEQDKKNKKD